MPRERNKCKYYQSAQDRECLLTNGKCVDDDMPCVDYTVDEIEQLNEEVAMLKKENEELRRKTNFTYCAYCGKEYPLDTDGSLISEHIKTCDKHPLVQRIATLEDALKRAEGSVFTVEELEGFLDNIFLKGKTRREKAIALHALLTTRKGSE